MDSNTFQSNSIQKVAEPEADGDDSVVAVCEVDGSA